MNKFFTFLTFFLAILLFLPKAVPAEELKVQAVAEKNRVYVGEPFVLQIQVDGAEDSEQPDMRSLADFDVTFQGGQQNSSQSISIVNGQMSRISRKGYVFNYQLSAKKEGKLIIPSLAVKIGSQTLHTGPLVVIAAQPEERDDMKLRLSLGKSEAYVGEPLQLGVTWYIGQDVNGFAFNLPLLNDSRFQVEFPPAGTIAKGRGDLIKVQLGDSQILASQGSGKLDGKNFLTVSFSLVLIPQKPGSITLPRSTVSCQVFSSYRRRQREDPLHRFFQDDIFNDVFNRSRGSYETVIVPSNEPELKVKDLPGTGRPSSFTGLVGEYSIATEASATEVNVGDPITLTILVAGPPFLGNVKLAPLDRMPAYAAGFKIPAEMAPGQLQGRSMVFTQTLRAKRADVSEIPPVELSYFNPSTGRYETARSESIPLKVRETRIVTAQDAEGGVLPSTGSELNSREKGIAHNYENSDALLRQTPVHGYWTINRNWLLVLFLPPAIFLLFVAGLLLQRRRRENPAARQAQKALPIFLKELEQLPAVPDEAAFLRLSAALRHYLGNRMHLPHAALTYADVAGMLIEQGVSSQVCNELQALFEVCEAARYGGTANNRDQDWQPLLKRTEETIRQIDRKTT